MNQTESRLESSQETASHFWDDVQPRIMLVDEDPKIHTFFAHTFRHSGFEVDFETSAIKALHRINKGYAVVISALYLLDMDGVELLKRIKQVDANIEMIIIGTSRSEEAISRVMRQGAMAYLSKPFESKSTVQQTVRRALERWWDTRNDEKLYHDIVSGLVGELNLGDNAFNLPFDTERFPLIDLLSMMNDGFVFLDDENRITFSNVKFSRKINWPYRAVFQKQFIKYVLREDRLEFERFLNQVRKERRTGIHETRMINRNGQVNQMMVTCRLIKICESQTDVILLVITDITEQREAQERARQLATLVDRARFEAIIVFNEESLIIHCNQAAEEMFGYPEGKLLGTKLTAIFSIDFENASDSLIKSRPGESAFELEAIDIAGNRFPVEISEAEDQNGKPGARIGMIFARDIRKRKQAEADLLMANKQLTKMYQELLEARNAQSLFFANMSHELKTPLNSIGGYASLMRDGVGGELSDKHAKWVESIKTQSSRLLSMIQDILEYAKLDRNEQALSLEPLDPMSFIQELKTTAIALVGQKPIAVYAASESTREHVVTDGEKLRHILMNILANAVKFTSKGDIRILLSDKSDSRIAFSISDTGCGIPEDKINKIFDDFYQVDENAASVMGSAGLGLAIVKRLVNSLGGTIEVESKPNHGSTFTVLLPIR
jgi:PAS domain S-box-containing protein